MISTATAEAISRRQNGTGAAAIWLMNGGSVATSAALGNVPAAWSISGTDDYNRDGKADILWRNTDTGDVAIWLTNGTALVSSNPVANVPTTWVIQALNAN
ncbi:MAG: hypothetical protein QOD74_1104 [Variibacter sp.]|nr:hypothetical protein [Variibacter sp.]